VLSPSESAQPVFDTSCELPDLVEEMWDWDVAPPHQAQALSFRCTPSRGLNLLVHYRTPMHTTWQFGSLSRQGQRHNFATMLQNGVVISLPQGPLGMIVVRLRPEAATRLVGDRLRYFLNAGIGLDDLFGATRVSLLGRSLRRRPPAPSGFSICGHFFCQIGAHPTLSRLCPGPPPCCVEIRACACGNSPLDLPLVNGI